MALCFLDSREFPDGSIRGAALVTDERTRPVEFRVTDAVSISPLQQMLYGEVLDDHVVGELIAVPLLEALREEIACVVVRDRRLLECAGTLAFPVLWVGRDDADELRLEGDAEQQQGLLAVAEHHDVLEPFERIAVALEHISAQAVGAQR